jgi:hypothetical protein
VILSVTSYLFNRRYGSIVDVTVGIPHVVPLETLRESAELKILLDLMFGEGWTIKISGSNSGWLDKSADSLLLRFEGIVGVGVGVGMVYRILKSEEGERVESLTKIELAERFSHLSQRSALLLPPRALSSQPAATATVTQLNKRPGGSWHDVTRAKKASLGRKGGRLTTGQQVICP